MLFPVPLTGVLFPAKNRYFPRSVRISNSNQLPDVPVLFYIQHLNGDTICIRSKNGLLWSLKTNLENAITTTEMLAHSTEKFTVSYLKDDDNKIALKASNGKYVSIGYEWPFIIRADADAPGRAECFRYFVLDK